MIHNHGCNSFRSWYYFGCVGVSCPVCALAFDGVVVDVVADGDSITELDRISMRITTITPIVPFSMFCGPFVVLNTVVVITKILEAVIVVNCVHH